MISPAPDQTINLVRFLDVELLGGMRMLYVRIDPLAIRTSFAKAATTVLLMFLALISDLIAASEVYAVNRALLTFGSEDLGMRENAEHLKEVLSKGTDWNENNIRVEQAKPTSAELKRQVNTSCGANNANDMCLFFYAGHGLKIKDNDGDDNNTGDMIVPGTPCRQTADLPCDETIEPQGQTIRDDGLPDVFKDIKGSLILVFDSCFSGGLDDGTKDLIRATGTQKIIFLAACSTNQFSMASRSWPNGAVQKKHGHGIFSGGLVEGLADSRAGAGPANADSSAAKGEVTVTEWFEYAMGVRKDFPEHNQTPEMNSGGGADPATTVVLKYTNGTTDLSDHKKHSITRADDRAFRCGCPECELDQFPTSIAQVTIVYDTPLGPETETITLHGLTLIEVDLPNLADTDGNGREQVQTQIKGMALTGTSAVLGAITLRLRDPEQPPFQFSTGQIEEITNNTSGVLDIPPFTATGAAESFFDIFFEIVAPDAPLGFQLLHNQIPKHMTATITHKPPAPEETYESINPVPLLDEFGNSTGITIETAFYTPNPLLCDIDGDGDRDRNDISLILAARGNPAGPDDPRDADGDEMITVTDAKICISRCTNPRCAP
jgi:hypothetical protein